MRRKILFAAAPVALMAVFAAAYFLLGGGAGDRFSPKLQSAADEWIAFADDIRKRFPDLPLAQESAKIYASLAKSVVQYDAEIAPQRLSRDERVARLKDHMYEESGKLTKAMMPSIDVDHPGMGAYYEYLEEHIPTSLTDLLDLDNPY